jgi:predicted Zn-dependent protease
MNRSGLQFSRMDGATTVAGPKSRVGALRSALAGLAMLGSTLLGAGAMLAPGPAQAQSLIFDDEIEGLLRDYASPILKAANLPQGRVSMRIINDPTFNAFVLDGHNVFIHTGLIMRADTPNQVIGVIAHEVGHIDGAHLAALRSEMSRMQTGMLVTRIIGIAAAVLSRNGAAIVAGDDAWLKTFLARRRSQEGAADQAGLKYLLATGQSGRGMLETFEKLGVENRAYGVDPYLLSHPTERTRIAQLKQLAEASPHFHKKDTPELQLRHDLVRAKLRGFTMPAQDVMRMYPDTKSLPARYARAIAANCSGNCTRAVDQIDALIRERPNSPYFHELKGHVYSKEGKFAQAVPSIRQALKLNPNSHLLRMELAKAIVEAGDVSQYDEAIRILELSIDTRPDDIGGYRTLARAYAARQRIADADVAMAQAHLIGGNAKQALIFAKRGQAGLQPGSRSWLKADDILKTLPREMRDRGG